MATRDLVAKRDGWAQRAAEWLRGDLEVIKARRGGGVSRPNDLAQRRRDAAQAYDRAFSELMMLPPSQRTAERCDECDRLEREYNDVCNSSRGMPAASA